MSEEWNAKAERLATALSHGSSGDRLLQIERLALENGISPQTAQHLLRAHGFIERLRAEKSELAGLVKSLPYLSLITLERWYARDPRQVLNYLKTNPQVSVRQLTAAEKAARGVVRPPKPAHHAIDVLRMEQGPVSPGEALSRILAWARIDPFDLGALNWTPVTEEYARVLGTEFSAVTPGDNQVALLVGPQSPTASFYNKQGKMIWYNSVCASTLFSLVIMLLPTKVAQAACLTSMPLPPSGTGGWPEWNTQVAPRGKPKSGPIRPASPGGGVVMVTTPEGICGDWRR